MENKTLYGRWMMIIPGDNYVIPAGYIEEITESQLIIYNFDKKHSEYSLKIDFLRQQFFIGTDVVVDYRITENNVLTKISKNEDHDRDEDNKLMETKYIKLSPTKIQYPIQNVLNNQYKLQQENSSGSNRDQILDFRNSDARRSGDLHIENILDTYFIVAYQRKRRSWFCPIKEVHKDHLLVYGLSTQQSFTKLRKYVTKKPAPPKGKLDVFFEPKLNLIIDELKRQKEDIKKEIDEATFDRDYLTAHHLMNNYRNVNRKFNIASSIKNKNHGSIVHYEFMLERYEERLKKETEEYQIHRLKENLGDYSEKIERLKNEKHELRPLTKNIYKAVIQLYRYEIHKIRLQLSKKHKAFLDIQMQVDRLVVTMNIYGREGYIDCDFEVLQSLNFRKECNHYVYFFDNFNENRIDSLITLLSRLTFEAFHHNSLDNPMELILS